MGRPRSTNSDGLQVAAAPSFRFLPAEVEEMEARLQPLRNRSADRAVMAELAAKFSASANRIAGMVVITPKQVHNWFCNRRYCSREGRAARAAAQAAEGNSASAARGVVANNNEHAAGSSAAVQQAGGSSSGNNPVEGIPMKFEAKSHKDGAWYDVLAPFPLRMTQTGELEAFVEFSGYSAEESEWVNVRTCLRQRSIPLKATECSLVRLRDSVLCYKESQQSGLYFDGRVLARKSHDNIAREACDCTFLIEFEHDKSEEIVPLRKLCRRPTPRNDN